MDRERVRTSIPSNCSVKICGLWKRSQGLSRFTKANYRHRVFILTENSLSYYCGTVDRVGQMKGRVSLETIRAVEFVNESAFGLAHTFQVVYSTKKNGFVTLYITATDKVECADWAASLRQACYFNSDMLMHYHPGAMLKNRWSCCHQRGKTSLGCQPTYHLLTRSSSRYAQMRRKDTLTGSSSSGRRRSKVTSTYETRRSASSATQNEIEVSVEPQRQSLPVSVGVGISNSCVELRESPPHRPEAFTPEMPSSQRSSQLSTEPSVSMSSITFTRVSVLEAPPSEHGSEANRSSVAGAVGSIDRRLRSVRGSERDRRSGSNRSQVAPESAAAPKELDHYQVGPLEPEEKTVMRPRGKSLGNEGVVNHFRDDSSPPPPVPPRRRSAAHAASPAQFVPSVVPITETSPEPGMKHSQTFTVSFSLPVQYHPQSQLSSSLLALTKPTIAPRVSNTDPNIIHV